MNNKSNRSVAAFERASRVLVGGVDSPVRAFKAVGGVPLFIGSGAGSKVYDLDGSEYVDYVGSYGPAILGHAHGEVVEALRETAGSGTSFGAPNEAETVLAEMIIERVSSVEKVRFVNSGTEAVMTACRLARGVTGRDIIIKCSGCYHGHLDSMLVAAGSGATTLGIPSSPGVPAGATAETLLVDYNNLDAVREVMQVSAGKIAGIIVEPIAGNMGVVPPADGYLAGLREICDDNGVLLILDEVMTGFRVAPGGAQELFGVRADITTMGKIIGGGLPVGAVGAPAGIMDNLAPLGAIYQAGTLSGNPLAMAAGIATLKLIGADGFYDTLESTSAQLEQGLKAQASAAGLAGKVCINRVGSMICVFFTPGPVTDYASATGSDTKAFATWFHAMTRAGIYLPPSQFETIFVSGAHSEQDISKTVAAAGLAFQASAGTIV